MGVINSAKQQHLLSTELAQVLAGLSDIIDKEGRNYEYIEQRNSECFTKSE